MRKALFILFVFGSASSLQAQMTYHEDQWAEAKESARESDKAILVDFYADWCIPCKNMDRYTLRDPEVKALLDAHFILVKVDVEQFSGMDIVDIYEISRYPTFVFADSQAREQSRSIGFKGANEFHTLLSTFLNR